MSTGSGQMSPYIRYYTAGLQHNADTRCCDLVGTDGVRGRRRDGGTAPTMF